MELIQVLSENRVISSVFPSVYITVCCDSDCFRLAFILDLICLMIRCGTSRHHFDNSQGL